jgi:CO/xanthine dehydrogenase FAD-binding subunit
LRLTTVEAALSDRPLTTSLIAQASDLAQQAVVPQGDLHAPAAYRSALLRVLVERALTSAGGMAKIEAA